MKDIKFDQEDINKFVTAFSAHVLKGGWQIKVNGQIIKTQSNKSLWATKGHAKSALKNHFAGLYCEYLPDNLAQKYLENVYHHDENKLWNNFVDFLETNGTLEFIELK